MILGFENRVAIKVVQKCGLHSIKESTSRLTRWELNQNNLMGFTDRVYFFRNPYARFDSIFAMMHRLAAGGVNVDMHFNGKHVIEGAEPDVDYRAFVDFALSETAPHFVSQREQIAHSDVVLFNRLHKFEKIDEHWNKYFDVPLLKLNHYEPVIHADYRSDEISELYARDFNLWDQLK